jgi:SAM-dependent methyltransferase
MKKSRTDKGKVSRGGATVRKYPSHGSSWLVENNFINGRVLDYGCGYGLDAKTHNWDSYDPYYNATILEGQYDTIVCTNVLSAVSRITRSEIIDSVKDLLKPNGKAFFVVPRNLPINGKLSGYNRRPQNNVFLESCNITNPIVSVHHNELFEIYEFTKLSEYVDKTNDR